MLEYSFISVAAKRRREGYFLVATCSVTEARAKGKARMSGKDCVMQDGDIVEFRFNN